jgi:hypothetical protein
MPEPAAGKPSVIISYAHRDARELALRLYNNLTRRDYRTWLDLARVEAGAKWSREIEDALERYDVMIALVSRASYRSPICRAEQLRALRKNKRIIPILVQLHAERPIYLEEYQYLDFCDAQQYERSFEALLDVIDATGGDPAFRTLRPCPWRGAGGSARRSGGPYRADRHRRRGQKRACAQAL